MIEEEENPKNWKWAYIGVVTALVGLMVFFYFFTKHFS